MRHFDSSFCLLFFLVFTEFQLETAPVRPEKKQQYLFEYLFFFFFLVAQFRTVFFDHSWSGFPSVPS